MDYAKMRAIADQFAEHAPPQVRAIEISGDQIVMMMSPSNPHELVVRRLGRQLDAQLELTMPGVIAHGGADLEDPAAGVERRPDLMVFPEEVLESGDAVHPRDVLAVVEVVSKSNPENDYMGKVRDYAVMGIAWYLIVDPRQGTGQILSNPQGGKYRTCTSYSFGETIDVAGWTVDTSVFPTY
ncbi:Uma2 family endonuclease [Streptomyces sp. NBC_01537]|uniref:Uma2 family endonuclease n=1 Tax=Streptomyces sp. NBC_01537 TaxID=2903896 RepID=UPI003867BA22